MFLHQMHETREELADCRVGVIMSIFNYDSVLIWGKSSLPCQVRVTGTEASLQPAQWAHWLGLASLEAPGPLLSFPPFQTKWVKSTGWAGGAESHKTGLWLSVGRGTFAKQSRGVSEWTSDWVCLYGARKQSFMAQTLTEILFLFTSTIIHPIAPFHLWKDAQTTSYNQSYNDFWHKAQTIWCISFDLSCNIL